MNFREWALPFYTILIQLAVGALIVLWFIRSLIHSRFSHREVDRIVWNPLLVIAFTAAVAMVGAHFHLSRPFHSFLAVLNFGSSWLSREIVFTVLFFLTTMILLYLNYFRPDRRRWITGLGWLAITFGILLIYCMARIYLLPTQAAWNSKTVIISFYATALMIGGMAIVCLMMLDLKFAEIKNETDVDLRAEVLRYTSVGLTILTSLLVLISLFLVSIQVRELAQGDLIARTSLSLLVELYLPLFIMRLIFLVFACVSLSYAVARMHRRKMSPQSLMLPVYLSCLSIIVGEILGRFLFYATHVRVGI